MSDKPVIRVERAAHLAEVVLDRADKRNAMGPAFWEACPRVFNELSDDPEVRVVLVRAEGRAFSAGLDLMAFAGLTQQVFGGTAKRRTALLREIERMQEAFTAIERCRKPVVAAIHGACIGGGLDLIAACCIRLASADATFSLREARLAIVADLGSLQRLPRAIGLAHTLELAYTAGDIDAQRALRMGLVSEVLPDQAALLEAARALCGRIAANPPLVVEGIKAIAYRSWNKPPAEGLRDVAIWNAAFLESNDLTEAVTAHLDRRPPAFTGD